MFWWNNYRRQSISSSSIDLVRVVSGYGTDSELDSTGNSEVGTLTPPLSMTWWFSLPMISETKGLVLEGEVLDLKWASGGWLFHYIGGSYGSSPWSLLNWFIFILIIGGRNFGPRTMQASALCPILPQHLQILFCLVRWSTMTIWRDTVWLFMEYEGLNY